MRKFSMFLALMVAVMFSAVDAYACGGGFFGVKGASAQLNDLQGGGYLVKVTLAGTAEEIKAAGDQIVATLDKCKARTCQCEGKDACPFTMEGLSYAVTRTASGLDVAVSGDAAKLTTFKELYEKAGKSGCGCMGQDKKGDCGCGGEKKGDCGCGGGEKKGDCGCGGEKKGDCGCGGGGCPQAKAKVEVKAEAPAQQPASGCGGCPHKKKAGGCGGNKSNVFQP